MLARIFLSLLSIVLFPAWSFSQNETSTSNQESIMTVFVVLMVIVSMFVLVVAIYALIILRRLLLSEMERRAIKKGVRPEQLPGFWQKVSRSLTRSTPVLEEETILMDHNYDGIRELDNYLPPWWKALFYFTIVWAVIYLLVYHVFNLLPLSGEEYNREVAKAEAALEVQKSLLSESINENTVEFTDDLDILANGESVFKSQCVVCHAADGGGGVGPNLTDEYWLHGGSIKNIYWIIKYGVPEKGMISWQSQLPSEVIRDVACYIITLKGTTPADPKEPQGEHYDELAPLINPELPPIEQDRRPTISSVRDSMNNIQIGRGLFSGSIRLNNGGPGCITCHHVTDDILPPGALIAPDLTNVYSRLDEKTIIKYATTPYHPTMQEAYNTKMVTEEEVALLISFFEYVGTETAHQQQRDKRAAGFLDRIKKSNQK